MRNCIMRLKIYLLRMSEVFDIAILGAGVTGLRLTNRLLSQAGGDLRVALIGPVDARQQRISFWHEVSQGHDYQAAIDGRWSAWDFRHRGCMMTQQARRCEYVSIDALVLKQQLEMQLASSQCYRLAAMVQQVSQSSLNFNIASEAGTVVARQVIDTRTPYIPDNCLKQQFLGVEVELTSPHGLKNPILMDFDITMVAADAVNFIYVLPIGEQRLFVEATIFSYDVAAKTDFYRAIDDWLDQHFAESILRNDQHEAEFATIPMGQVRPIEPSLVGCGVGGGATRASTGYAFKGAERQIQQLLLQAVSERRLQHVEAYSRRARLMDAIFLEVTKTDIQVLPELFGAMASRLNGDDFADFLSDSGGWGPLIRTILAAPKWPFIKAAGRLLVPRR